MERGKYLFVKEENMNMLILSIGCTLFESRYARQ